MHTFLIAATTLDGKIGQNDQHVSTAWTSQADKHWFHQRTKQAGVVVMGAKTYDTIGRPLPGRLTIVMSTKAVSEWDVQAETKDGKPKLVYTNLQPAELVKKLKAQKYPELAVCGGSTIYTLFAQKGLIDTFYITFEPKIFGQGLGLFNQPLELELELAEVVKMDEGTLLLTYKRKK